MEYGCSKTINRYLSNSEIKLTFLNIIIAVVLVLGIFLIGFNVLLHNISASIVRENIEVTGKLIEKYPQLEDNIAEVIKEPTTAQHIIKGREVLSQYGYKEDMSFEFQNSINSVYRKSIVEIVIVFIVLGSLLLSIVFFGFSKIYSKVDKTTYIMEKITEGNFSFSLKDDGEEIFDVFGCEFNKMSNCFKLNIDKLKKEKVFLKNIIEDISHQLKTPISTLIAANDIMAAETDMSEKTRKYFIERSKKQLERIEWLVRNMLKLAMLDAGIIVFNKSKVNIVSMIKKAISSIDYLREEKSISIHINENITNSYFLGDANWTGEAILNIVKNSIEHTPNNGQVVIDIEQMKLLTKITIYDNGEGIEPDEITKIFERFHKCKSKYKDDSVGIGLSLSKRIIEGQDGVITVQSKIGQGSSFSIILGK
ncbi:MAG: HAMP domain-containing histidine kinase [Clostridium beijerinckii]|nr:HAMP domain-containing histidine kinase [Clostridium beijerinckii]MCI1581552.1 HAMP domain-containing histidine kinase [Clostridium beijerinckii]MCI1585945.1 HAMP domain-containing histidine kinase [Clostridium beijerinckii]MCI1625097.1 HAMP domain-containing histidine kinase [Clostridium beijerinckii]